MRRAALALLLLALAAAARAQEPAAQAVLAVLPFQPAPSNDQIVIDLAPRGNTRRLRFQLDTGASTSMVTPQLARAMGVKVSAVRGRPHRRKTVLGRDVQFWVDTRRSDTGSRSGLELGVLGGDFLSDYVVELDFAERQVRFLDPDRFEVPEQVAAPNETVLPFQRVSNRIGVRITLDEQPVDALFDTGSSIGLLISGQVARSAAIEFAPVEGGRAIGSTGSVELHAGSVGRLGIGSFEYAGVDAAVSPTGFFNVGFPGDVLIGIPLLRQFLVRIDYPRQRIWLRREAAGAEPATAPSAIAAPAAAPPQMPAPVPPEPEDGRVALAPRDGDASRVWLEWKLPDAGTRFAGPVGFAAVEGWAGVGAPIRHDVVLAIDVSGSTAVPAGTDVDGDGKRGRAREHLANQLAFDPRELSTDPGDTVLAAELAAARRLVELLDPDRTRIGIVAFSDSARILAPLGSERARIEEVLAALDQAWGAGGTDLAHAIARGAEMLTIESPEGPARRKTLIVLSDGYPSLPGTGPRPAEEAWRAAFAAGVDGVRIDAFGLGLGPRGKSRHDDVYQAIAEVSSGRYVPLPEPGAIVEELPRIDLADVASIEIENATSGEPGRAVRVLPDGCFDGLLRLENGENRIRVTARGAGGESHSDERVVFYERRAPRDAEEAARFDRELAALRSKLERRRIESELIAEIQAARTQQRRLEVSAEEAAPQP